MNLKLKENLNQINCKKIAKKDSILQKKMQSKPKPYNCEKKSSWGVLLQVLDRLLGGSSVPHSLQGVNNLVRL